jgi:hypothetical protein
MAPDVWAPHVSGSEREREGREALAGWLGPKEDGPRELGWVLG